MAEEQPETTFVADEITTVIRETVESTIGDNSYQGTKINQWISTIVESSISRLTQLGKPFKYIVTCIILQKNGAGLHTANSCFWDNTMDGSCTVRWENNNIYCVVTVFGLAI